MESSGDDDGSKIYENGQMWNGEWEMRVKTYADRSVEDRRREVSTESGTVSLARVKGRKSAPV